MLLRIGEAEVVGTGDSVMLPIVTYLLVKDKGSKSSSLPPLRSFQGKVYSSFIPFHSTLVLVVIKGKFSVFSFIQSLGEAGLCSHKFCHFIEVHHWEVEPLEF